MKHIILLATALAAIPIAAVAQQTGLTSEQIVAARQSAYAMSAGNFVQLKAQADAGADVRTLGFPARTLARWARTLPSMFPAGTNLPNSKALPTVWSDRAGFEARAAAYAAAATALAEAAQSGDRAVFLTRWAAVRQTCSDCHDTYRAPD
jgi:cytochrome c556